MIEGYKSLWAKSKPRHPLWKHLLDAGAVSLALDTAPPRGWSAKQIALIVGLHDVGKAMRLFSIRLLNSPRISGRPAILLQPMLGAGMSDFPHSFSGTS
jgi:HD domain